MLKQFVLQIPFSPLLKHVCEDVLFFCSPDLLSRLLSCQLVQKIFIKLVIYYFIFLKESNKNDPFPIPENTGWSCPFQRMIKTSPFQVQSHWVPSSTLIAVSFKACRPASHQKQEIGTEDRLELYENGQIIAKKMFSKLILVSI